jgi:hypothetical protein
MIMIMMMMKMINNDNDEHHMTWCSGGIAAFLSVPVMRNSIIQMEVVVMALHEQLLDSFKV